MEQLETAGVAKVDILITGDRAHLGHLDGEAVGELLLLSVRKTLSSLSAYSQIPPERIGLRYVWAAIQYTVPIFQTVWVRGGAASK